MLVSQEGIYFLKIRLFAPWMGFVLDLHLFLKYLLQSAKSFLGKMPML